MEFAKRISIFFAAMSAVLLPWAANAANRGEETTKAELVEKNEANAAAAMVLVVGVGLVLMNPPDEEPT